MSRDLQLALHGRLTTAVAVLDLPLNGQHLERLAIELTPAVAAMLAEVDATVAELEPVSYALTEQAGPVDRHISEYAGCRSAIHPEVEEDSPAALLALELRGTHDVTATDVPTRTHLTLTVRPLSLLGWQWWLDKMSVSASTILRHGPVVTGTGHYGEITVHLRGENVGDLLDDQAAARSARRLQGFLVGDVPARSSAGHPW
ncbi:hypothetical protein [Streptomyces neyagawaensis]|uniref:hypothetical protein n=1 Tax=Streptomyces neyagawaensis TaxID=42238 RepID=UPI000AC9844E|nr:hypothetical protein [Streptomyces neyagawaensis]MCL6733337.1 hypothetical protein [Streptomyces neyagawaensis]MDE1685141.1 hypothetical protein [Streptomyces neyagawaensis]